MINIDARIENADWPKRTPDSFADLGLVEKREYVRDEKGRFAETATITVGDRLIEVVKPRRAASDKLVPLHVLSFDQRFKGDPNFYLDVGGGKNAIGDRYKRFEEYINTHDSIEASEVYVGDDGRVGFTNGRHRYAWLRDHGLTSIPVAMDEQSVRNAKKFGYLAAVKMAWDESKHVRDKEGQFTTVGSITLLEGDYQTRVHQFTDGLSEDAAQALDDYILDEKNSWALDRVVNGAPRLPGTITTYRGVSTARYQDTKSGDEIETHGVLSTSLDPETARIFSRGDTRTVIRIQTDRGLWLPATGMATMKENELLLPRKGYKLRVTGVSEGKISGTTVKVIDAVFERGFVQKAEYKFGNTQIQIDPHSSAAATLNSARNTVRDEHLAGAGKDVDPNHLTVRYGLLNEDLNRLRSFIAHQTPFEAQVVGIELFPASEHSDGAVPIVARIASPELRMIEAEIGKYADFKEKSFPVYKPHCTIAYCKPEDAEKYTDLFVSGSFLVHGIMISHQSGVKETIPFGMTQKKQWDESKHRRQPSGSGHGGEFAGGVLHAAKDALDSLLNKETNISIQRDDVRTFIQLAGEQHEDPDLTDLQVEGMDIFGGNGLGIDRKKMPQIPRAHRERFLDAMEHEGVTITVESVDPLTLKPTQNQISARKVAEKMREYEADTGKVFPPLLVSNENRILDGHHHWGMMAVTAIDVPTVKVPIYRLNISTKKALALMLTYMKANGIKPKSISSKWEESKHPRDKEGQFTESAVITRMKKYLRQTTAIGAPFLLPDGTRLSADYTHANSLLDIGVVLEDALKDGVIRVKYNGVDVVGGTMTEVQAQTIVDDWIFQKLDERIVDVRNEEGTEIVRTRIFDDRITATLLRNYVNRGGVKKADPATGRYVTPFVSFDKQGDDQLRMIASLNSSRLATWGFTAEAEVRGMARYRLSAVLDGRTSKFCRMVDGKIFQVEDAREKVIEALNVQNPEDLRVVQPWPKQTIAALKEFRMMSAEELTALGFHIPPYHPYCRTICRIIEGSEGEDMEVIPTVPEDAEVFQPVTQADLQELGVDATPEQVADWNAHIGMSPVELIAKLTGMTPQEILTKGKGVGANPVQFDASGNIGVRAHGESTNGIEFKLGAILDPFTGIYYLSQAELLAGTPKAELAFLKNLFWEMIGVGQKSTATSVAVGVAGNAAYYAKLGFLPDDLEWDSLRTVALGELETGALKPILASLSAEDALLVKQLLQDGSPSALSALVELPFKYQGKTIGEWLLGETAGTWELDLMDDAVVAQAKAYLT